MMMQGRMDAPSSENLVVRAQSGDHAAINRLLESTQSDLRRFARRNCRLEDVDDAVQQSLAVLARRITALRSPSALAGWLFMIVRRECYRLGRWTTRALRSRAVAEDLATIAARPDPDLRYDLGMAILSLPAHYRAIVIKRDLEELTIDEIASAEGLTREAVKARLHRARLMIRDYLDA